MSFATQEDIFAAVEPVLRGIFEEFGEGKPVTQRFPLIPYAEAMLKYGSTSRICATRSSSPMSRRNFRPRRRNLQCVQECHKARARAIPAPGAGAQPRSFFDKLNDWARGEGAPGLGYVVFEGARAARCSGKGPIAKVLPADVRAGHGRESRSRGRRCAVLRPPTRKSRGRQARGRRRALSIGRELGLIRKRTCSNSAGSSISRCTSGTRRRRRSTSRTIRSPCRNSSARNSSRWIRPTGRRSSGIKAFQYDIVCNGIELSVRRHPQPRSRRDAEGLRDRRLCARRAEQKFAGMLTLPLWRAAAWRHRAGHRPHRHADRGRGESTRNHAFPDEPAGRRPDDGRALQVTVKQLRELHIRLNLPETKG